MKNDLFSNIYKPDVLSCLADLSNDEVFTPPEVANKMLDLLPQEIFRSPDTKFLDPACKSGVFLREIAKRLIAGLADKIPNLEERCDWIFKNQLYGIAITELTSLLSRRSVYCSKYPNSPFSIAQFDNVEGNIVYHKVKHTWDHGKCIYCGTSENAVKKARQEKGDELSEKEKKELSEEEKEYKTKRKEIQQKLIKFATRIPIFMYLTDYREHSLKDVITQFEPGLFKKVTGLTVHDFELLVSIGLFNDSLMNQAIYNFKRYEDASLEYTGINKHADDENIGLFSTVISKKDYEDMATAQTASMMENPFKTIAVTVSEGASKKTRKTASNMSKKRLSDQTVISGASSDKAVNTIDISSEPNSVSGSLATYGNFEELDLSRLRIGTIVLSQKYGEGKITKFNPNGKIMVSFPSEAPKTFQVPDAFVKGYLRVKEF